VKTSRYLEGKTELIVPAESLEQDPPPTFPVFFNPAASVNRDVSVAVVDATSGSSFCDAMAGVGARGIRVATEVKRVSTVALVDFNEDALKLARRSAALNGIGRKCEFSNLESSAYLYSRYGRERRFDYVDVDPFGTPVRQLQAALSATADGGILSVTATDTAVLCGVYPDVSRRRYGAQSLNNQFNHETGIRILLGAIARLGASLDIGVEPVAAHSTRHYLRGFVRVAAGALKADRALGSLGFVVWCPACGQVERSTERGRTCAKCGKKAKSAGPLWAGGIADKSMVERAAGRAEQQGLKSAQGVLDSLVGVDSYPPWSFEIGTICSNLKIPSVPEERVFAALRSMGYRSRRTPFERKGVKTGASYAEVVSAVSAAVG